VRNVGESVLLNAIARTGILAGYYSFRTAWIKCRGINRLSGALKKSNKIWIGISLDVSELVTRT